ncbi:MAG: ABC transporter ATP-binding protein, partial [Bacilli bacterium]|nr:ABC transporter ATP-binding protein [Bacilli bacterium]
MSSFVIKKLGKRFVDGKRVFYPFRKVSFSLPDSGLVSIRGKSGSGKSTLLNLLAGLLKPDEGKIIFQGKDIARLKAGELEDYRLRSIGFVYQHYNLLPSLTAYENIALPLKMAGLNPAEIDRRIKELAKRFSLGRLLHKLTSLDSGGEKQRIAIVRALANDPDVILADEPTGALDVKNSKLVMEMLKEISKERLVVMVSHNDFLIEAYSDSIFEISNGVLSGRIKEAKTNTRPHWKKKKRRDGWSNLFVRKHFLDDRFLNAFSFLSCLVGFIALLFSAGFYSGSEKGGEDARWKNAEAYTFSLSEKSYQEVDGSPLRLVHSRRPKLEDISAFALEGVEIENDYSYFLPDLHAFSINGKPMEGAIFRPIGHHDDSLLKIGDFPHGGLLANEEAMEKFDGLKLGDEIRFDLPYSLSRFGVKDEGVLSFAFVLTGVVSEFSFLNSARFYYDYGFSQEAMKGEALPAISEAVGEKMNIDSLISSL